MRVQRKGMCITKPSNACNVPHHLIAQFVKMGVAACGCVVAAAIGRAENLQYILSARGSLAQGSSSGE